MRYVARYKPPRLQVHSTTRVAYLDTLEHIFEASSDNEARGQLEEHLKLLTLKDGGNTYRPQLVSFVERTERAVEFPTPYVARTPIDQFVQLTAVMADNPPPLWALGPQGNKGLFRW